MPRQKKKTANSENATTASTTSSTSDEQKDSVPNMFTSHLYLQATQARRKMLDDFHAAGLWNLHTCRLLQKTNSGEIINLLIKINQCVDISKNDDLLGKIASSTHSIAFLRGILILAEHGPNTFSKHLAFVESGKHYARLATAVVLLEKAELPENKYQEFLSELSPKMSAPDDQILASITLCRKADILPAEVLPWAKNEVSTASSANELAETIIFLHENNIIPSNCLTSQKKYKAFLAPFKQHYLLRANLEMLHKAGLFNKEILTIFDKYYSNFDGYTRCWDQATDFATIQIELKNRKWKQKNNAQTLDFMNNVLTLPFRNSMIILSSIRKNTWLSSLRAMFLLDDNDIEINYADATVVADFIADLHKKSSSTVKLCTVNVMKFLVTATIGYNNLTASNKDRYSTFTLTQNYLSDDIALVGREVKNQDLFDTLFNTLVEVDSTMAVRLLRGFAILCEYPNLITQKLYVENLKSHSEPDHLAYCYGILSTKSQFILNHNIAAKLKAIKSLESFVKYLANLQIANILNSNMFNGLLENYSILNEVCTEFQRIPVQWLTPELMNGLFLACSREGTTPAQKIELAQNYLRRQLDPAGVNEERLGNINNRQSTHTASVHKSVSESAARLQKRYSNQLMTDANKSYLEIQNYIQAKLSDPMLSQHIKLKYEAALRCLQSYLSIYREYKDPTSNIKLTDIIVLVWTAIHDKKSVSEHSDLEQLKTNFVDALYQIQREYNIGENNHDNGLPDNSSCAAGAFNKIVASQNGGVHTDIEVIVVSLGGASARLPMAAQEWMNQAFKEMLESEDITDMLTCVRLLKTGEEILNHEILKKMWNKIVPALSKELFNEFGSLFEDINCVKFTTLIEGGRYADFSELPIFSDTRIQAALAAEVETDKTAMEATLSSSDVAEKREQCNSSKKRNRVATGGDFESDAEIDAENDAENDESDEETERKKAKFQDEQNMRDEINDFLFSHAMTQNKMFSSHFRKAHQQCVLSLAGEGELDRKPFIELATCLKEDFNLREYKRTNPALAEQLFSLIKITSDSSCSNNNNSTHPQFSHLSAAHPSTSTSSYPISSSSSTRNSSSSSSSSSSHYSPFTFNDDYIEEENKEETLSALQANSSSSSSSTSSGSSFISTSQYNDDSSNLSQDYNVREDDYEQAATQSSSQSSSISSSSSARYDYSHLSLLSRSERLIRHERNTPSNSLFGNVGGAAYPAHYYEHHLPSSNNSSSADSNSYTTNSAANLASFGLFSSPSDSPQQDNKNNQDGVPLNPRPK